MPPKPHPNGMHRKPLDHDQPTTRYEITDGTQPVGVTERINEGRARFWRAVTATAELCAISLTGGTTMALCRG